MYHPRSRLFIPALPQTPIPLVYRVAPLMHSESTPSSQLCPEEVQDKHTNDADNRQESKKTDAPVNTEIDEHRP